MYNGVKSLLDALPTLDINLDAEIGVVVHGWFEITATKGDAVTVFTKLGSDCRTNVCTCTEDEDRLFRVEIIQVKED